MAAEGALGASVQPVAPSIVERAPSIVERAAQKMTAADNQFEAPVVSRPAKAPFADIGDEGGLDQVTRQVRLDFRTLRQSGMITPDGLSSGLSNEFRGIKRKLLQKVRDPKTRATVNNLVMVTSSLPGEGKTFSSMNLAISLAAEKGLRVLLIDADVIRPSVGNMFISPPSEGLTDLLSGSVKTVSEVTYGCPDVPNLSVIFAGNPKVNSPELISSGQMASLCQSLSTGVSDRVIVIDTPPVLASTESAILASYVHQLIMVVSSGQTDKMQLRRALDSVSSCPNISLLFNKAPRWNEAEYNGYYGYGYGYGDSARATSTE
jgi:receptor protein-tyrosine kinase